MAEELQIVYKKFKGKLIGGSKMKQHVCETVSNMPPEILEYVTQNCWFMSSMEEAWAFTFTRSDLADHHLVFLSDELLMEPSYQIHFTIAHEIGHIILKHHNAVLVAQTKQEITEQETQADEFAEKSILNR